MKNYIKTVAFIIVLATLFSCFCVSANSLSWDGSSAGGGGGGEEAASNGYAIRYTEINENLLGYRFSAVDKSGANKVAKSIDVFRDTYYGNYEYSYAYKFSKKYNKKQLINSQSGNYSTTQNSTNCYKETSMGFATALPVTSGMSKWQNNTTNLNKVLSKLGIGSITNLKNGDKIIVEPLYDVRLESVYHALTVTEIAIYGKHILGASSNGGSSGNSESWGFIAEYTNKHYPNSLYTPDGQGLWTGVSKATSQLTFYNMINKGYGAGIAYTETKPDFTPALTVKECRAYKGISPNKNYHHGTSTGNLPSNYTYVKGYPVMGETVFFSVYFPKESENIRVQQSVWVDGVSAGTRTGYSNDLEWYNAIPSMMTVPNSKMYYYVKARVDHIDDSGNVKKTGAEKTFYIPVRPLVKREQVTAYNIEGETQAYSGSGGSSGKMYFGQNVTFQYKYTSDNTWASSNNLRAIANRWNGSAWTHIYSANSGNDVYVGELPISKSFPFSKNSSIGKYLIPKNAKEDTNSYRLKFDMKTAWEYDPDHTTESTTYYLPIIKSDVELTDMKLADSNGNYVDRNNLTVGDKLAVHYFYKNNTDCKVYVKGYNDDGSQIPGVYAIPAGKTIEVEGATHTVPNERSYSIWGGVYLDTVAKGNTSLETIGMNNSAVFICKSKFPVTLVPISPNAKYRENTQVISSFWVKNDSYYNYKPSDSLKVRFRVFKNGQSTPFYTETKSVVVPSRDKNLVYFKWSVPVGMNSKNVTVKADVYDGTTYYNLVSNERATMPYTQYNTPDTRYEESAPKDFYVPSKPNGTSGYATWWEYVYTGGSYKKKTYGIGISNAGTQEIVPASSETSFKKNGVWTMKSGYGFTVTSSAIVTSVDDYGVPGTAAYTSPQYAYVLYPEYEYLMTTGKYTTLVASASGSNLKILPNNQDYGHVHFTPLWFPNGDYTVKIVQSDLWTPAGMVNRTIIPKSITIDGNAYDDWYEARR
ncbi:MAG: hypothetical protein K6F76_00035 [Clostridiales bacterium]|nr:hypothetical protein [Clostridiales bacterium]